MKKNDDRTQVRKMEFLFQKMKQAYCNALLQKSDKPIGK